MALPKTGLFLEGGGNCLTLKSHRTVVRTYFQL